MKVLKFVLLNHIHAGVKYMLAGLKYKVKRSSTCADAYESLQLTRHFHESGDKALCNMASCPYLLFIYFYSNNINGVGLRFYCRCMRTFLF